MKTQDKFLGITLPTDLYNKLDALCHDHRISKSNGTRIAIEMWIESMRGVKPTIDAEKEG